MKRSTPGSSWSALLPHRLWLALAIVATPALNACYSYAAVYDGTLNSGSLVQVRFSQPREIVVVRASGDSSSIRGVAALKGGVLSAVGDTLMLRLTEALDVRGERLRVPPGSTVAVKRDVGAIVATGKKISA